MSKLYVFVLGQEDQPHLSFLSTTLCSHPMLEKNSDVSIILFLLDRLRENQNSLLFTLPLKGGVGPDKCTRRV